MPALTERNRCGYSRQCPEWTLGGSSWFLGQENRVIKKRGDKWVVTTEDGRTLGTHDTRAEAVRQLQAVEASKQMKQNEHMNKMIRGSKR